MTSKLFVRTGPMRCLALAMIASLGWHGGCAMPGRQARITVGNPSAHPIRNVRVADEETVLFEAERIDARSPARAAPLSHAVGDSVTVTWTTHQGETVQQTVAAPGPLTPQFRGRVVIEIDPDQEVRLFVMPYNRETSTDIPWGRPASWEGSPAIPGLTRE